MKNNLIIKRKCKNKDCLFVYKKEFFKRQFSQIDFYYTQKYLAKPYSSSFVITVVERKCPTFGCVYNILFVVDILNTISPLIYVPHYTFLRSFGIFYAEKYFYVPFLMQEKTTKNCICQISIANPLHYVFDIYSQDVFTKNIFMLENDQFFIFTKDVLIEERMKNKRFKNEAYNSYKRSYPYIKKKIYN